MMARILPIGKQICELAVGRLLTWQGLHPFPIVTVLPCLLPAGKRGWLQFNNAALEYMVFHEGSATSEVWLFGDDNKNVCLVEVFNLPADAVVKALWNQLGTFDLEYQISLAARLQRPEQLPGPGLLERVYSDRGLALASYEGEDGQDQLVRVRGFEIMSLTAYLDRFVNLPAVRFFPESN